MELKVSVWVAGFLFLVGTPLRGFPWPPAFSAPVPERRRRGAGDPGAHPFLRRGALVRSFALASVHDNLRPSCWARRAFATQPRCCAVNGAKNRMSKFIFIGFHRYHQGFFRLLVFLNSCGIFSERQVIPDQPPQVLSNGYLLMLRISNKNIF
jgi:hypothetical protein